MADLTLKNCILAKDFTEKLSDTNERIYFEHYLNLNSVLKENLVINLDVNIKNQNETLPTGHLIVSLDVIGRVLKDFIQTYGSSHSQ